MLASVLKYSDTGGRGVLAPRALPTSRVSAQVRRMKSSCSHTLTTTKTRASQRSHTHEPTGVDPETGRGEGTVANYYN